MLGVQLLNACYGKMKKNMWNNVNTNVKTVETTEMETTVIVMLNVTKQ